MKFWNKLKLGARNRFWDDLDGDLINLYYRMVGASFIL